MKKSDVLKAKIAELSDKAEALVNIAEQEGRELTAEEKSEWSGIMDAETGELAKAETELKAAQKYEAEVARIRAAKATINTAPPVYPSTTQQAAVATDNIRVVTPHLKAFKGADGARDAYDAGLWVKASRGDLAAREKVASRRGDTWLATLNETTPTSGGMLVPAPLQNALMVYREQVGVTRRLGKVIPMSSDNLTFVKQTGGSTVYYPGEEGQITASSQTFGSVTLQAKKRACLGYISSELADDAIVSAMDIMVSDMGHQLALQEDKEFVLGDGTSTYGSVVGVKAALTAATASLVSAATNNDTWPEITYADLAKAMAAVSDAYRGLPMAWLCSAAFKWQVFDRLTLAQGGALEQSMINGVPGSGFAGYPIVVSDRMPTTTAAATLCAIFGAFGNAVAIGDRNEVRFATSEHLKFDYDQTAVRATVRYDIQVHQEGDTSTAGAIIGFKTAS